MRSQRGTQTDGFHMPVIAAASAVSASRVAFEDWVSGTGANADVVHELSVVFSELVANAVTASGGGQPVEASAWADDGTLVLRVVNTTPPPSQPVSTPDLGDPLRTGGRGLMIVRAYTDSVRVETGDGRIAIRCERRVDD